MLPVNINDHQHKYETFVLVVAYIDRRYNQFILDVAYVVYHAPEKIKEAFSKENQNFLYGFRK